MAETNKQERVAAFIDSGWLLDGLRGQGLAWRLDYGALLERIAGERTVSQKFAYIAPYPAEYYPNKAKANKELMTLMDGQGFDTRMTEMQVRGGMYLDLGIDVLITRDIYEQTIADSFDTAIIVSRRPTLAPVVESLKAQGKTVENAFFEYQADPSNLIRDAADSFFPLTLDLAREFIL